MAAILSILAFIGKNWRFVLPALLIGFLGVQTLRLGHAKADQWDRSACTSKECKGMKWQAEVAELRPALAQARADLTQCQANRAVLQAQIDGQNVAIETTARAAQAASDAAQAAVNTTRAAGAAVQARASAVLAAKPAGDACAALDALRRAQ